MHHLTRCEVAWWKDLAIRGVVSHYGVDLGEAKREDYRSYKCFNEFFTRELKESLRPIDPDAQTVISPADGCFSELGSLAGEQIVQAKDHLYTATDLLGGDRSLAKTFENGRFATIYLSPRDYHRLHMPCRGTLIEMRHVPGRLFSVNAQTTATIPNLFARNERVIALFDTVFGKLALVLVGAIFVSSIETVWHGVVTPPTAQAIRTWNYREAYITLDKGQEMGRFNMGSTIVVLFQSGSVAWCEWLGAGSSIKMGQAIGKVLDLSNS